MRIRPLGTRVLLKPVDEVSVSRVLVMLSYEHSTYHVVASGWEFVKEGDLVIVDRSGSSLAQVGELHVAYPSAILAKVKEDDTLEPAPGLKATTNWKRFGGSELQHITTLKDVELWDDRWLVPASAGYVLTWKSKVWRACHEDEVLAEVSLREPGGASEEAPPS